MEFPFVVYLVLGVALLGMTVLPRLLADRLLTLPLLYVGFGLGIHLLPLGFEPLQLLVPSADVTFVERATELTVITSLCGVGLKLDRPFSWGGWSIGWRLLGLTMPLCIAAVAVTGWGLLDMAPATAILLGAVLAPTDPVLADDVQAHGPHEGDGNDVRFGLTLEAGLNDALAFPFVYLAIRLAEHGDVGPWMWTWLGWELLYRVVVGAAAGAVGGVVLSTFLARHADVSDDTTDSEGTEGLFILGATLVTYSLTEAVAGYGFLAVFVAAVVGKRRSVEGHNTATHRFIHQVERLLLAGVLIGFGGMLSVQPERLLDVRVWATGLLLVLVFRPLFGWVGLLGAPPPSHERAGLAFFGIRGIGSLYYLAYAMRSADFPGQQAVWPVVVACILCSMVLHGFAAQPLMTRIRNAGR